MICDQVGRAMLPGALDVSPFQGLCSLGIGTQGVALGYHLVPLQGGPSALGPAGLRGSSMGSDAEDHPHHP
jgi:hypothetical protein